MGGEANRPCGEARRLAEALDQELGLGWSNCCNLAVDLVWVGGLEVGEELEREWNRIACCWQDYLLTIARVIGLSVLRTERGQRLLALLDSATGNRASEIAEQAWARDREGVCDLDRGCAND